MVGMEVRVGVGMAVGPKDPERLMVVDCVLQHASVTVFRPFGGRWKLRGDHCLVAVGCWMGEGRGASLRVGETGRGN
jgi:hypothetical protein